MNITMYTYSYLSITLQSRIGLYYVTVSYRRE